MLSVCGLRRGPFGLPERVAQQPALGRPAAHAGLVAHDGAQPASVLQIGQIAPPGLQRDQQRFLHDILGIAGVAAFAGGYGAELVEQAGSHRRSMGAARRRCNS